MLGINRRVRGKRSGSRKQRQIQVVTSNCVHKRKHCLRVTSYNRSNLHTIPLPAFVPNNNTFMMLGHINPRAIRNKIAAVLDTVITNKLDICTFTETWLSEHDAVARRAITPEGYTFRDVPREGRRGGGTGILCRDIYNVQPLDTGKHSSFEHSSWKLTISNRPVSVHVIYRPPYSEQNRVSKGRFLTEIGDYLEGVVASDEAVIVTGDFNLHVDKPESDNDAGKFLDLISSLGLQNHVWFPTQESGHTLDLIISRTESNRLDVGSPYPSDMISDHNTVCCPIQIVKPPLETTTINYRKLKSIHLEDFKQDLAKEVSLVDLLQPLDDLVLKYDSTLNMLVNKHAPLRTRTIVKRPEQPWFNDELRDAKISKRRCERKWRKSKDEADKWLFKKARNKLVHQLETSRNTFYTDKINACEGDTKKLFNIINDLTGKKQASPLPPGNDMKTLADSFAEFFLQKVDRIQDDIYQKCQAEGVCRLPEAGVAVSHRLSDFKVLEVDDVLQLMASSASKHCRLDPAPTWLVKECRTELLPLLLTIINRSLQEGHFPCQWKCAMVTPLLKKPGLELEFSNYRPVSNLPYLSKLVEKACIKDMMDYLNMHELLPPNNSAYRQGHSTETIILKICNDLLMNMEENNVTLLILLDLSAAFDTVKADILLDTLHTSFGIGGKVSTWLHSYLTNRKLTVKVKDVLSEKKDVRWGVPQGSCLGPILFTLYLAPMYDLMSQHHVDIHGYADDNQLLKAHIPSQFSTAKQEVEEAISDIRKWMLSNCLKINDGKTEVMVIGGRQQLQKVDYQDVTVGGISVPCSDSARNLGVMFDPQLTMDLHVNKICQKSFHQLYLLREIKKYLPHNALLTMVHAFITSNIDYCNSICYGLPKYKIEKLQRIQNTAAKMVKGVSKYTSSTDVLRELHWLPVTQRVDYKIALLTYKCLNETAPGYLCNLVTPYNPPRTLRSSSQNFLDPPKAKKPTMGRRSFAYAAPTVWKSLPPNLREPMPLNTFKLNLKTFLFTKYFNV